MCKKMPHFWILLCGDRHSAKKSTFSDFALWQSPQRKHSTFSNFALWVSPQRKNIELLHFALWPSLQRKNVDDTRPPQRKMNQRHHSCGSPQRKMNQRHHSCGSPQRKIWKCWFCNNKTHFFSWIIKNQNKALIIINFQKFFKKFKDFQNLYV